MNFAVIQTGGKQYKIAEGDSIKIEKILGDFKVGDTITFDQVLLTDNGSETVLGTPFIEKIKVEGTLEEIGRHQKVITMRYKQKSRSGIPKNGHRQPYFKVKINKI